MNSWTKTGANNCNYFELTRGLGSDYPYHGGRFQARTFLPGTHPQLTAVMEALKETVIESGDIDEIVPLRRPDAHARPKWDTMRLKLEFSTACAVALYLSGVEPGPDSVSAAAATRTKTSWASPRR